MSVKLVLSNKNGMMLYTKKTYVEDDIQLVLDEKLFPSGTVVITENGTHDVEKYTTAEINVDSRKPEQSKEVEYNENGQYIVSPEEGHVLTDVKVTVNVPIPEGYIKPEGTVEINSTEEVNVTEFAKAQIKDDNLKAENIAKGITILGIDGAFKGGIDMSDATVAPDKMLLGEVAYGQNEERIVGSIETYDYSNSEGFVSDFDKFITGQLTEYYNDRVTTLAGYAMRPISSVVTKLSFPNVEECNTSIYGCGKLKEVYLPKVTTISIQEFQGCTVAEIIEIPNVLKIEMNAFNGCKALERLEFNNLTYIANTAFTNCSAFKTLILRGDNICQLAGVSPFFKDTLISNGTGFIYVPDELVEQYKEETNWSSVADQIKPLSELEE